MPDVDVRQATSITFAGIVACQIDTALAAFTDRASLSTIGRASNPSLLRRIALEPRLQRPALIYSPAQHRIFDTALVPQLLIIVPFPIIVWGVDELFRWARRARTRPAKPGDRNLNAMG